MQITRDIILQALENAEELYHPTQGAVSLPIITRIYKKMLHGVSSGTIHVHDDLIVDGHHRYICSLLADYDIDVVKNYPIPHSKRKRSWDKIDFSEDDWDTVSKIKVINEHDAENYDMSVEEIVKMIE